MLWGLVTLLMLAIALPSIIVKLGDEYYRIRGLDPKDIKADFLTQEFRFTPSLDLSGGSIATVSVDMTSVAQEDRQELFRQNEQNLLLRLFTLQSFLKRDFKNLNFELQEAIATDNSQYQILAKFPEIITEEKMYVLATPGDIAFWIDDSGNPEYEGKTDEELPYGQRKVTELKNDDIASVDVITDASCYFSDPKAPRNFCLRVNFLPTAQSKFNVAFLENQQTNYPPLLTIDGAAIAVRSSGKLLNATNPGLSMDFYPVIDDSYEANAILASVLNTGPLSIYTKLQSFNTLEPVAGANALTNLKYASVAVLVAVSILLLVYFRKNGWFAVAMSVLFWIFTVAGMKIFGVVLDIPLVGGVFVAFALFLSFVSYLLYLIRTASRGGLSEDEIAETYAATKANFTKVTIFICILSFVVSVWAPATLLSWFIGLGFGVIWGFVVFNFLGMELLKLFFIKTNKWKIW